MGQPPPHFATPPSQMETIFPCVVAHDKNVQPPVVALFGPVKLKFLP